MSILDLTGLQADLPIGAMAAFGTLRICQRLDRWKGSKLSWRQLGGSYLARLHSADANLGREDLIADLLEDVGPISEQPTLKHFEQIKAVKQADFVRFAEELLESTNGCDRDAAAWLAALANDVAGAEGLVEASPFDMSVARQSFPSDALKLARLLSDRSPKNMAAARASYVEALFGPWAYRDDQHSFGWDPTTMKLGAFTHKAPTKMANTGVRAAVWLAFESLPLFPSFFNRELVTRAFRKRRRTVVFCWPLWENPISLPELETLLGWKQLVSEHPDPKELEARGVFRIYHAERFKPNKYLASFRSAEPAKPTRVPKGVSNVNLASGTVSG